MPGVRNVFTMGSLYPQYLNGAFRGIARLVEEGKARVDALNRFHYYWIFFQRGVIYFNTRSAEDALPDFLFHVKNVEDSEWGHYYLGAVYQKQGMMDRARIEYGLCLKYAALKNNEYAIKTVSRLLSEQDMGGAR